LGHLRVRSNSHGDPVKECPMCGLVHIGLLVFATAGFRLLFEQDFEQWCDLKLSDEESREIRWIPLIKIPNSALHTFIAMANTVPA